jgi:hypothetical protein
MYVYETVSTSLLQKSFIICLAAPPYVLSILFII